MSDWQLSQPIADGYNTFFRVGSQEPTDSSIVNVTSLADFARRVAKFDAAVLISSDKSTHAVLT